MQAAPACRHLQQLSTVCCFSTPCHLVDHIPDKPVDKVSMAPGSASCSPERRSMPQTNFLLCQGVCNH